MKRIIIVAGVVVFLAGLGAAAAAQIVTPPQKKVDQIKKIAVVEPESVTLNKSEIWVFVSSGLMNPAREGYRLAATVLPANATSKKVVWESSDPGVVTVDAEGHVRPVKTGSAVVRATTVANKLSAECRVTVELKARDSGNTVSHLSNRGYMARQGSWIYFADPGRGMRLSKMKIDGSAKTPLCNDQASFINVSGGTVFYVNNSDGRKLYSVDIYGENRTWLNDSNPAYGAHKYGDEILYGSPNPNNLINLYMIKTDGTGRRIVDWPGLGSVSFFHRSGGAVFYSLIRREQGGEPEMNRIMHRALEAGRPATTVFGDVIKGFTVEIVETGGVPLAGRVFYISKAGEIRVVENFADAKQKKDRALVQAMSPARSLSLFRSWIYYSTAGTLNKVRADGRENQVLVRLPEGSETFIYPMLASGAQEDTWIFYYVLQTGTAPRLFKVRADGLENTPVL